MRTCARWRRRDALPLRSLLLLVLVLVLLTLQLLVIGTRLPHTSRPGSEGREGAIAFSVINIDPGRNVRRWKPTSRRPLIEAVEGHAVARAYEDENEMLSRKVNRNMKKLFWVFPLTFKGIFNIIQRIFMLFYWLRPQHTLPVYPHMFIRTVCVEPKFLTCLLLGNTLTSAL